MATDSGTYTPETIQRRYKIAEELLGSRKKPITHWAEGLDELAKGYFGGKMYGDAQRSEREGEMAQSAAIARLLGGSDAPGPSPQPMSAPASSGAPMMNAGGGNYGDAIASIESGGKYDILGHVTKTGDRAYGKYQIMGNNIPQWSQAALGRQVTPQEFLADPKLQDQIFQHRFGDYVSKYGPEGAAKAWFAGEKGMNNPNAKDQLGTTVSGYGARFMKALGGAPASTPNPNASPVAQALQQPVQTAQAGGTQADIVRMLNDPNPYVRRQGQALGMGLVQKKLAGEQPTDEIKEYNLAKQQGYKGSFLDFKTEIKKAGAIQNSVQIDQKTESEFDKEAAKSQAKRFNDLADEAPKAQQMMSDLQVLTELGKNIGTGKGAEVKATLGPYAEALGIKIDGLSDIQAFEAVANRVAPNLRVPGSGAQSDYELRNFVKSLPTLGNTPEGNEIAASVMQGLFQNKIKAAEIGSKALSKEITRPQAEKMLRELPDPLGPYREYMKKNRSAAAAAAPAQAPAVPQPGTVMQGYRFKGGDPSKPESWEKVP